MRTLAIAFTALFAASACASTPALDVSGKTLPDPSPVNHPDIRRGSTVMVNLIFKFRDKRTGEEGMNGMIVTGVVVGTNYVLTSASPLGRLGAPESVTVAVPDYEKRRHKYVTNASIAGTSNHGLLLLKTEDPLLERAVISDGPGPNLQDRVRTVDVLNGKIPGVMHAGTVSYVVEDGFRLMLVDVNASISSIGCGIYDDKGELAGIVISPTDSVIGTNFSTVQAVSAVDIRTFLDANGVIYTTSKGPSGGKSPAGPGAGTSKQ